MKNKRRILAVLATFALASFGMGVAACKEDNPDPGEFTLSGFEVAAEAKGNFNETFTIPVFAPIDGNGTVYTVTVTVTCGGEAVQVVSNKIVLNRMEDYVITYSVDGTDIVKTMTVSVTDSIAPTVKVTGGALNRWYFAGSSITPPTFSVTDNADSNLGYTIDVFRGDEKVKADVKEAFTLTESGKYTLVASAKDKSDNVGKEEIPFIVREASAKGEVIDFNDAIAFDCVTAWNNNDTSLINSEYVTFEGKKAIKINSCDANGNPVKYPGLMLAPAVTKAEAQALYDDGFTSISLEYYIDYTASRNIYQKWGEKQSSYTTQLKRWDTVDLPLDIFIENYDSLANGTKSLFFISNDEEWTSDKVRADFDFYVSSAYITKNVEDIKFSDGGLNNVAGIDDEIDVSKITASSETARDMSFAYAVLAPDGTEINLTDGKFIVGDFGVYKVKASSASKCYKGSAEYEITVKASVESVNALINEILTADDITTMGEQAAQLRAYYATLTAAEKETVNFTSYIRAVNLRKENDTLYFLDTVDGKQQIEISCSISTKPTALETNDGVTFVTDVKHGDEAGSTKIEFIDVKTEWFEYFNIELKKPSDIDLSQYPYVRFYIMGYTWDVNRPLTLAVKLNGKRIESMSTPVPIPSNEWYEVLLPVSMFDEGNKVELAFWTLKDSNAFGAMWNAKGKSHLYISAIKAVELADDFKFSDEFTLQATYDAGTTLSLEKMLAASAKNPQAEVNYFITSPDGTKTAVTAESQLSLLKAGTWTLTAEMSGSVYGTAQKSFEVVIYEIDDLAFPVDFAAEEQYELNTELSLENMVATSVKYPELEVTKYTVTDPEGKVTEVTAQDTLTLSIAGTYTVKAVYDTLPYNGVVERVIRVIDALEAVESVNALIEEILSADDITSMGEKATQLRESYEALSDVGKEMVNFTSYVRASNLLKDNNTLYFLNTVDGKRQIEISCSISGVPTPLETNDGVTYVTDVKHSGEAGSTKIEFTDVKTEWFEYFNIWLKKPSDIDLSQYAYVRFYIMGHTWSAARPLTLAVKLNGKRIESMSTPVPIPSDEWYEVLLPVSMFDEGNKVELAFWTLYGTNAYGSMWNAKGKSHAFISAIKGVESADDFEFSDEFTLQATYDAGTKLSLEKMLAASASEPGATVTYFAVSPDKTKTAITAESEIDLTKAGIWTIVAVMNGEKYGTAEKSFEVVIYEIDDLAFSVDFAAEEQYELNAELSLENMVAASETYPDLTVTKYTVKDSEGRVTEITADGTLTLSVAGTYTFKAVYDILPYSGSIEKQIKVVDSSDKNIYFAKTNSLLTGIVGKAYGNENISNEYVEQFEGVKGVVKVCTDTESGASTNAWKWPGLGYDNALLSQDDIADYKSQGYKYVIVPIYYAGTKSVSLHYGISPNDKVADLENGKWNFVEIPLENVTKLADAYFLYINNESGGAPVDSKVITYYLASMYLAKEKPVLAFSSAEENAADMVTVTVGSATPAAEVCTDTVYGKEQSSIKFTVTEALSEVAYLNIDKQFSLEGYSRVFMYIRTTASQVGLGIYNGNTRVIDFRHSYLPTDEWVKVEIPVSLLGEFEQMKLAFINYGWNTKIPAGTQFWISDIYVDIYAPLVLAPYGSDASGSGIKYSRLESFKGETDVLKCSTLTSEGAHNNSWKYPALRVYLNYTNEQLQALKDGGKSSLSFKIYIDNEAENTLKWGFGEYAVITTVTPGEWVKVDLNLDLLLENYDAVLKAGNTGYVFYIDNFSTNNHDLHFYIADMHVA